MSTTIRSQRRRPRLVCPPGSRRITVVSHISHAGVAGSNCSHRGRVSFWVRRVKIANIDASRGSLERRASAILSRARSCAAGKLNLGLQALVAVLFAATQDRKRKPATGRQGWSQRSTHNPRVAERAAEECFPGDVAEHPVRRSPAGSAWLMKNKPETAAMVLSNPAASADAHQLLPASRPMFDGRALGSNGQMARTSVKAGSRDR
jgi:hypothetical protein